MTERVARISDAAAVEPHVSAIVLAFGADPFVRWLFPEPHEFLTHFHRTTQLHGASAVASGGAWGREDARGAAFWYPPGVHPDRVALRAVLEASGAMDRVAAVFREAAQYEPDEPFWYLRQIGVDPTLQGRGAGAALIEPGLAEADAAGTPAYLEASSERGVTFYERQGFVVQAEVSVGGSAPIWPMLRPARGAG